MSLITLLHFSNNRNTVGAKAAKNRGNLEIQFKCEAVKAKLMV